MNIDRALIAPQETLLQERCDLLERLYSRDYGLAKTSRLWRRSNKLVCVEAKQLPRIATVFVSLAVVVVGLV